MNIYELAKIAGVSSSTISRVMNNKPGVGEAVRQKIKGLLNETGYSPNLLARELSSRKTRVIGVVMPGINSFFTDRIEAINNICRNRNYSLMITANSKEHNDEEAEIRNFELFYEKQVEGIIYFATKYTDRHRATIQKIIKRVPVVSIDRELDIAGVPCVVHDNYSGAKEIMECLISEGHSRISFIQGPSYDMAARERFRGYRDVLNHRGTSIEKEWLMKGTWTFESGYSQTKTLLSNQTNIPTAIFAANDNMAIGSIKAIREAGLKVPEDISVAGYDDIQMATYCCPSLTTIRQDQFETGLKAIELLFNIIEENKVSVRKLLLVQKLMVRESTGTVK